MQARKARAKLTRMVTWKKTELRVTVDRSQLMYFKPYRQPSAPEVNRPAHMLERRGAKGPGNSLYLGFITKI